jgi:hypothetical protein
MGLLENRVPEQALGKKQNQFLKPSIAAKSMKPSSTVRFSLLVVPFLLAFSAQANTETYDLTFNGFFSNWGSGTATFDDTPAGPGNVSGETRYDFTSFVGSGSVGTWTHSYFDYNPTTGLNAWDFFAAPNKFSSLARGIGPGLSPIAAIEQEFTLLAAQGGVLTWSRVASGVPDGGSALAMLGLGMTACAGLKRRWAKP